MATQAVPLSNLAELQSELTQFPHRKNYTNSSGTITPINVLPIVFILSDEADIYLTPINTGLQVDCDNFFFKTSFLTPSEVFLALFLRLNDDRRVNIALINVIDRVGGDRFIDKEPEGLTKIVQSLGKNVLVHCPDINPNPIPAILESVTPAYDGQALPINWVIRFSVQISKTTISREIKAPLFFLSRYFVKQ